MKRSYFSILALLLVVSMVLAACGATAAPAEPTTAPEQPTAAPEQPTAAPTTAAAPSVPFAMMAGRRPWRVSTRGRR
jgi:peptide/nickel transport system substrate-binding protein